MDNINYFKSLDLKSTIDLNDIYRKKATINDLPYSILANILSYLSNTWDYKRARKVCKRFYWILENFKVFGLGGEVIKKVYFKHHSPYKCEMFRIGMTYSADFKYYMFKVYQIKRWRKNGIEFTYSTNGEIKKKINYKMGKKHGITIDYYRNKPILLSEYSNGLQHGRESIFSNQGIIFIDKKYVLGNKIEYKKFIKNKLVMAADFNNNLLEGELCLYFAYNSLLPPSSWKYNIKTKLLFKNDELHGLSYITQYDRILKLNFVNGTLDGVQQVFDLDHNLSFVGEFKNGVLNGNYSIFSNGKKTEYGEVYSNTHRNIWSIIENVKLKFPLKCEILNGEYIEQHPNNRVLSMTYLNGTFNGSFTEVSIDKGETIEIKIYNRNNFEYKRHIYGDKIISLKKTFGTYILSITNLKYDPDEVVGASNYGGKSRRYITYRLTNYLKYVPDLYDHYLTSTI